MIEIKIPKEINEYKEKFLFGLTVRQFISAAVALAVCVPLFIFGKDAIGEDMIGWIIILIGAPIIAFGFFHYNGMNFEDYLLLIYRQKVAEPQKRVFIDYRVFWYCRQEIIDNTIAHQLASKKNYRKGGKNVRSKKAAD